ncbi:TMEM175 family protein [Companilactobacillus sp. DQM5]|uniref:TMEM175 family protein n=1 Tax=Companilactobacillus sp. DQM5 TaxID=3463359 RepID=UPI00405A0DAD
MSKERLTTFIDAVLAIVMTILVLELEKPRSITPQGFWELRENFFAYTLSFFWLGSMWVHMHNEWYHAKKIDNKVTWTSLIMLFCSSLFPYATSIVASNFYNTTAQVFYGVVVLSVTLFNTIMYSNLKNANKDNEQLTRRLNARNKWIYYDIAVKIIGLISSIVFYPPAMIYAVLLTAIVITIFPLSTAKK